MICSGSFATLTIRPLGNLRQVLSDHGRGNDSKRFSRLDNPKKIPDVLNDRGVLSNSTATGIRFAAKGRRIA